MIGLPRAAHFSRLVAILSVILIGSVTMPLQGISTAGPADPSTPPPPPPGKNSVEQGIELGTAEGSFTAYLPAPSSKNGLEQGSEAGDALGASAYPPAPSSKNGLEQGGEVGDALGASVYPPAPSSKNDQEQAGEVDAANEYFAAYPPDTVSKNYEGDAQASPIDALAASLAASGSLLTCGASGNVNWTTTSGSFQVIRQCTLSIPQSGWVFISADGSLARTDGEYEGLFEIGIDSTAGDANIDRWGNVYNDSGDGTDKSVALSVLKPIAAGNHTFYSLGRRYSGTATVLLYDPTLTVIYIPSSSFAARTCGASGNVNWTTTSGTFQVIRQCTLSVPQSGWVFISADGSLARSNGEYEGLFEIGIDSTAGDYNIDRWGNVYNDSGDGTDESVALSVLKPITAGNHTFYFLGRRYSGTATVLLYDPTLTVIVPGVRVFLPLIMRAHS